MLYQEYFEENDEYQKLELEYKQINNMIRCYQALYLLLRVSAIFMIFLSFYNLISTLGPTGRCESMLDFLVILRIITIELIGYPIIAVKIYEAEIEEDIKKLRLKEKDVKLRFNNLTLQLKEKYELPEPVRIMP